MRCTRLPGKMLHLIQELYLCKERDNIHVSSYQVLELNCLSGNQPVKQACSVVTGQGLMEDQTR